MDRKFLQVYWYSRSLFCLVEGDLRDNLVYFRVEKDGPLLTVHCKDFNEYWGRIGFVNVKVIDSCNGSACVSFNNPSRRVEQLADASEYVNFVNDSEVITVPSRLVCAVSQIQDPRKKGCRSLEEEFI